jgi:tetratricopeptide (TPR) repeat protein
MSVFEMSRNFKTAAVALLMIAFVAPRLHSQSPARDELNLGVQAYRQAKYDEATQHFEKAVALAPENGIAQLYLATTYAQQYIPGADDPENNRFAEKAIEQYQHVLDSDVARESKLNSTKGIAYLYLNMKKFDDSSKYYEMAEDLDPKDPEPYYSIGVIDWTKCYQPRMEERARLGLKPGEALNPTNKDQKKVCDELRAKNQLIIEEGIDSLNRAIELRPDYDDAMAYMNLMYRERADVECDDLTARDQDFKTADEWVDKTLAVKKARAKKSSEPAAATAPNPQ